MNIDPLSAYPASNREFKGKPEFRQKPGFRKPDERRTFVDAKRHEREPGIEGDQVTAI